MFTDIDRLHKQWELRRRGQLNDRGSGRTTLAIHEMIATMILEDIHTAIALIPQMRDIAYLMPMIINIFSDYGHVLYNSSISRFFFADTIYHAFREIQFKSIKAEHVVVHGVAENTVFTFDHHGCDEFEYRRIEWQEEPIIKKPRKYRSPFIHNRESF